jgi:hypothetical protein
MSPHTSGSGSSVPGVGGIASSRKRRPNVGRPSCASDGCGCIRWKREHDPIRVQHPGAENSDARSPSRQANSLYAFTRTYLHPRTILGADY